MGDALGLFLPLPVRRLRADAAALHADHGPEEVERDLRRDEPVVGLSPDAWELRRAFDVARVPDLLPQLVDRRGARRRDHDADQHSGGLRPLADEVLGLGHSRDRRVPDLPHPRDAALHPAVQDVRDLPRLDRDRAHQSLVRAAAALPDADGPLRHLDHDRLFRLDPEGARRGGADRRRELDADAD